WREAQAVRAELGVQLVEHDARLDARPALANVHFQHAVEVLRCIELEAGSNRLSGLGRAAAARRDRRAVAPGDFDGSDYVLAGADDPDPERFKLVHARGGRVQRAPSAGGTDA